MTFTILGTAAAEGWPALWCPCEACEGARSRGGKDIRRRASYQLGDRIHVDLGPDTFAQMLEFDLDYALMEHLLITHSHSDHLHPQEIGYRRRGFTERPDGPILNIHGNEHVRRRIEKRDFSLEDCFAQFVPITPFVPIDLGEGVIATPIIADHAGDDEMAVNYLFERDGRTLLQGNDTGWWPDETWEFLARRSVDVLLIECTYGPRPGSRHHLGANEVVEVRDNLLKLGTLSDEARIVATHFSHNGGMLHEELEDLFSRHEIEVAFDGMQLEL